MLTIGHVGSGNEIGVRPKWRACSQASSGSANFVGNTLTQSEAIETYTPYDVTSMALEYDNCIFCQLWKDRKIILRAGPELKFENYESVQHRLQFSGIKKGAKISFHRHFKVSNILMMLWRAELHLNMSTYP